MVVEISVGETNSGEDYGSGDVVAGDSGDAMIVEVSVATEGGGGVTMQL